MTSDYVTASPGELAVAVPAEALQPIPRRKLAHELLDRLLARLRAGEFAVGSHLPSERELMQAYSVGRPAVREALQALERMGLVSIVHGERARVLPLSAQTVIAQISDLAVHLLSSSQDLLEHLKEARCRFEVDMVRIAAERATKGDIETLRRALEAHRASLADPSQFLRTDMAFHRAIAAISRNPIYLAVSQAMLEWLEKFHIELVRAPGAEQVTFTEHEKVFERIAARDREGAAKAITAHLTRANRFYRLAELPQPVRTETSERVHGK